MSYRNPVIPGFHPDPSICRVGEDYYLVTSSFEYFPGVPIFHSRDLVHWRQIGHCLTRRSQLNLDGEPSSGGIYAPTIRYAGRRFFMITTHVGRGGNFYVSAEDPAGDWTDPIFVAQDGIDPSLLFDGDGRVYLASNGGRQGAGEHGGIYLSEIEINNGRLIREPALIWEGTGGAYVEGPHIYHIGDWYYLLAAEGGTEYGHMVTLARSRSPYGPFANCPRNPVLTHRSTSRPIQATGHADLVEGADGRWWLVCLGIRPVAYPYRHHLGRETFLAPVTWDADGWPTVGTNGRLDLEMEADCPPLHPWPAEPVRDDFDRLDLRLCWNFRRNPGEGDWSLAERPGWLRLRGNAAALDDVAAPAFLGRRQEHFHCRAAALLDFEPGAEREEAGLAVIMNERFHYEIALARLDGERRLIARRRLGTLQKVEACLPCPEGQVILGLRAEPQRYVFTFARPGGETMPVLEAEPGLLSTEVAGGFTGVYLGLYATGNGRPCSAPADFDWFEYQPEG